MSSALAGFPLRWERPEVQELRDLLARTLFLTEDIVAVVRAVPLNPGAIALRGRADNVWMSVLDEAAGQGRVPALIEVVAARLPGLAPRLSELGSERPAVGAPGAAGPVEPRGHDERVIVEDDDTLIGVAFLEVGALRARSVCRLAVDIGDRSFHGSGARIGRDLVLTNHHVLHDADHGGLAASRIEAWFGYEHDGAGVPRAPVSVAADPATIVGDATHDWAVVRLTGDLDPVRFPPLALDGATRPPALGHRLTIVQHPEGGPKMIGMHHNLVVHVDDDVVQYWTDTKPGSSGSPVFDEHWDVVALHHRAVESDDGRTRYRNQGRRIERVRAGLAAAGLTPERVGAGG